MRMILIILVCLFFTSANGYAANDKIDPKTYICAELIASNVDGEPPLFSGLQLDGYAAGLASLPVADPSIMETLLITVADSCAATPAEPVLGHWQEIRKKLILQDDGPWNADKTKCADYESNPDDGSGFVIWLDGYQRAKTKKDASIFANQETLDQFLAACKAQPDRLMLDVMQENAK